VQSEHECAAVGVQQEAVAPAATCLLEARPQERHEDTPRRKFGKPGHRLGSDDDLDGDERLAGRLSALLAQRRDVELERGASSSHGLASRPAVDMTAGYLGDRRDEAAVRLTIDGDHVAEFHAGTMSDEP